MAQTQEEADLVAQAVKPKDHDLNTWHGGVKTSFYSKTIRGSWQDDLQKAMADPSLLSLTQDVAVLRILMSRFIDGIGERTPTTQELEAAVRGTEAIGRAVERIAGKQKTLTAKGAATLIEIIMRTIMEELGDKEPKAVLRVAEKLKQLGSSQIPKDQMKRAV